MKNEKRKDIIKSIIGFQMLKLESVFSQHDDSGKILELQTKLRSARSSGRLWDIVFFVALTQYSGEKMTVSDIYLSTEMSKSTAIKSVTRLVDLGVLERRRDHENGRRTLVTLNPQYRAALEKYFDQFIDDVAGELERAVPDETLTEALDSNDHGVVIYDSNESLVFCNAAHCAFFPEVTDFMVHGTPLQKLADEINERRLINDIEGITDDRHEDYLEHIRSADGEPLFFHLFDGRWIQATYHRTPNGGLISLCTDVTLLKRRELELRDSLKVLQTRVEERSTESSKAAQRLRVEMAERGRLTKALQSAITESELANHAKSNFLANMSHELRTPLNSIIGFSDILRHESENIKSENNHAGYAQIIYESGNRLLQLINDILDFSVIEIDAMELVEAPLDIAAMVRGSSKLIHERARPEKIQISVEIAQNFPNFLGDERRIKQILINLLSNAVKFTPQGGSVTVEVWCDNDGAINVRISDNGIGIAAADIPRIMNPFGQVESAETRSHEGTGLGLSLVKSLTDMHGGTIEVVPHSWTVWQRS